MDQLGGEIDERGIPWLGWSPAAQAVWDTWRSGLEERLRGHELAEMPAYASHLAKYRSLMPSLALVAYLLDVAEQRAGGGGVSRDAADLAVAWCEYLELHAARVYAAETFPGLGPARALARKIETGAVGDGMTLRDIYRCGWTGLGSADAVQAGADVLARASWCRLETVETGGRPKETFVMSARVRANHCATCS